MGTKPIKGLEDIKGLEVMMVQGRPTRRVVAMPITARDWAVNGKCSNQWREWDEAADRRRPMSRSTANRRKAQAEAAALCAGCPVAAHCLIDAVEQGERWTIRGGLPAWRLRELVASLEAGSRAPLNAELRLMEANAVPAVSRAA